MPARTDHLPHLVDDGFGVALDDAERRLERVREIADMGARPFDDLAVEPPAHLDGLAARDDLVGRPDAIHARAAVRWRRQRDVAGLIGKRVSTGKADIGRVVKRAIGVERESAVRDATEQMDAGSVDIGQRIVGEDPVGVNVEIGNRPRAADMDHAIPGGQDLRRGRRALSLPRERH